MLIWPKLCLHNNTQSEPNAHCVNSAKVHGNCGDLSQRQSWSQLRFMTALHGPMCHLFRPSLSNLQNIIKFKKQAFVELPTPFHNVQMHSLGHHGFK